MICNTHDKEFKQFYFHSGFTVQKVEYMCPECRDILYKELGYEKQ